MCEEPACAAIATLNLVENEKCVVIGCSFSQITQKRIFRQAYAGNALYAFHDYGGIFF